MPRPPPVLERTDLAAHALKDPGRCAALRRHRAAPDALGGFALGDSPSVAMVMINGEIVVARSKMTVPTQRFYRFVWKG